MLRRRPCFSSSGVICPPILAAPATTVLQFKNFHQNVFNLRQKKLHNFSFLTTKKILIWIGGTYKVYQCWMHTKFVTVINTNEVHLPLHAFTKNSGYWYCRDSFCVQYFLHLSNIFNINTKNLIVTYLYLVFC